MTDIDKAIDVASTHFSAYVSAFFGTLRSPTLRFTPVTADSGDAPRPDEKETRVNPQLFVFAVISIFLGFALQLASPLGEPGIEFFILVAIVVVFWLLFGWIAHGLAKLLGGTATLAATVTVVLQVLGVVYVVGNVAALVTGVVGRFLGMSAWMPALSLSYVVLQVVMLAIYIPAAMKGLHGLSRWKTYLLFALLWVVPLGFMSVAFLRVLRVATLGDP